MAEEISAQEVANAFVRQYYMILHLSPEESHKFYQDSSVIARPGSDGRMTQVSTMKGINDEIMSIDYKKCTSKIDIVHAQSSNESVLVGVTGHLTVKDNLTKNFTQTFLLAPQTSGGYYVMNDFLFYFDVKETVTSSALSVESAATIPLAQEPEPTHVLETKKVGEKAAPKPSDQVDNKNVVAKSDAKDKPASSKTNVGPVPKPAETFQADPHKQSYASMVAKESEASSPTPVVVRVNPGQQSSSDASWVPKPAASQAKAVAPTSNGAQGNFISHSDEKSIHIRGLPYEITDEELSERFKKFGAIRERSIRIKRFEDGFCFAFLEFETAKSAHSAVETETAVFKGRYAQIQYKKPFNQNIQGGNNRGRSPSGRGGYYNDNFRGRENYGEGHWGGRYESGRGSPTGRNENYYNNQARGSSRGRYENYHDQARGSSNGRNGEFYQRRGYQYQNGGGDQRVFRQGGGN